MKKFILYAVCLPNDLAMLLVLLFVRIFWGSFFFKKDGYLWVILKEKSWLRRTWGKTYSGVCLGHGGILVAPIENLLAHELVHLEQHEVAMMKSLFHASVASVICAIFCSYQIASIIFCSVWFTGYLFFLFSGWIVAAMRDEDPYKGSSHEEAAYAIAEDYLRRKEGKDASRRIL
jgi:hypothetical protein